MNRAMVIRRLPFVVIVLALAAAACARDVSTSELSGRWKITDESRRRLGSEATDAAVTIRLDEGGTFSAREMPASLLGGGASPRAGFVSGEGTWKLAERSGRQKVELVFDAIAGRSDTPVPYGTQLDVWSSRSSVLLYFFQGDPDAGPRIELEKDAGSAGLTVPSAAEIRRSIQEKGGAAALADLTADENRWDEVLDRMSKGDQEWLDVVGALYQVADGGAALDLGSVAAEALAAAPKRVLEVLEPVVGLETLCDNDFSVGVDFKVAIERIDARRTAVKAIQDPGLSDKRLRCLSMLDTLEADMRAAKERGDIR